MEAPPGERAALVDRLVVMEEPTFPGCRIQAGIEHFSTVYEARPRHEDPIGHPS